MNKLKNKKTSKWTDIDCNSFNEDEEKYYVIGYESKSQKEGTVIAKIDYAEKTVEYIDKTAETDKYARNVISEFLENGFVLTE